MEHLRIERTFRYAPDGIRVIEFQPGEYPIGDGEMTEEVARQAIADGYGLKVRNRYAKKVIRERVVK